MKTRPSALATFAIGAALVLFLSWSAPDAYAGPCSYQQPVPILSIFTRQVINNQPGVCSRWDTQNDPTFGQWGGGSNNLPVVTALIGLFRFTDQPMTWRPNERGKDPNPTGYKISYRNWWVWFLASQLGDDPMSYSYKSPFTPPPIARPNLKFFKGTEMFSNIYEAPVVISVIAAHYWGRANGDATLGDLAQRYLRANWALYALAAGRGPVWTYEFGRQTSAGNPPIRTPYTNPAGSNWHYDPAAPRKGNGYYIDSPFLALAGTRSKLDGRYDSDDKFTLFDRAVDWQGASNYENGSETPILDWLQNNWNRLGRTENLYGLTPDDVNKIKALVSNDADPEFFIPWMGNIRFSTEYRIVGWPGYRASWIDRNVNFNDPTMYGVLYTADDPADADPSHAKATFLFPWSNRDTGRVDGFCGQENARLRANNFPRDPNSQGDPHHPPREVFVDLPTSRPAFALVLSPVKAPYLEDTTLWPSAPKTLPSFQPVITAEGTGFGGDVAWVRDMIPEGGSPGGYNETWDWSASELLPITAAQYLHRSALVNGDVHQHYFAGATETLAVNAGESLYAYVYLDPVNPPSEVMLQWYEPGTAWEHRAYWGANRLAWGTNGTASRLYMGPLPASGEWARLEVPAKFVDLEGRTLTGMAFTLFDGKAAWDAAGKSAYGMFTDLALGAPATQSSTWGGIAASLAVDGNKSGSYFSHTDYNNQAWWQVDLGGSFYVDQVKVWNRTDCCSERLSNFDVLLSDAPFNGTAPVYSVNVAGQAGRPSEITMQRRGRYVRVRLNGTNYLSLSEVEVFGTDAVPVQPPPPSPATANVAWVKPAEVSWGPANTLTAAGYAQNGTGGVQLVWRDETAGTGWNTVAAQATPAADGAWSNTIPSSNKCHTFRVYVNYSGVRSAEYVYDGVGAGYCPETSAITWIQPQANAGFGPPGSLVIAGNARNAPTGTPTYMSYRDVTAGTAWMQAPYAPVPDSNGTWYNSIDGANTSHTYQVQVRYDAITSRTCTYQAYSSISWCQ